MQGLHIIADLYSCPKGDYLVSADALRELCVTACKNAGLSILGEHFYQFDSFDQVQAGGATGAVILAESHLAIHTWPERDGATLDIYVCNVTGDNSPRAESLYASLLASLLPADVMVKRVWRGKEPPIKVAA
ncbi:MAG: adenosylmethionine decarboxylase [Burkholderiales bacterium]|nr:adenosylmethionine decarboxylase [Burkholderiales bacterium]